MSTPLPVGDELADDFMVTDPPYGVEYDPSWRGRRRVSSGRLVEGKVLNDDWAEWRGQLVYDPFLGLAASLIAAEMTGRSCCGLPISPSYVDVILRRWQAFTGGFAIRQASGQFFDERAASQDRDRSGSADG
jgi:DNA modification methylase